MFSDNTIRKRVMEVVDARIANAQRKYDEKSRLLDDKVKQEIEMIHVRREAEGQEIADVLVAEVFQPNITGK